MSSDEGNDRSGLGNETYLERRDDRIFRVSEITNLIKETLESSFGRVQIEGEISNFRPASSGHLYFSLKDNDAVIQAVMFRGRAMRLDFQPADGHLVIATGNVSVYAKRGNYQIICESLQIAGTGAILAMLEERKRILAAEGLFDESRKQAVPLYPSRVAVVTSPTGAAIRDILRVIGRRSGGIDVVVLPAPVQGDEAAAVIARQIRIANLHDLGEVIIIGRGGGSLEDLLPFSDEEVVRAVAASRIPVISAVGHEIDIALSDLAADVRAPTPSAAAEIVSARRAELLDRVRAANQRIRSAVTGRIEKIHLLLGSFSPETLERSFRIFAQPILLRVDDAKETLLRGMSDTKRRFAHRLELARKELEMISPISTLEKGYAIVQNRETGELIRAASTQKKGSKLRIRVFKGALDAEVEEIIDEEL